MTQSSPKLILVAEDDYDDYLFTVDAIQQAGFNCEIAWVQDGEELLDYLFKRGEYAALTKVPNVILMDLFMPKLNGYEALQIIKAHPPINRIPVMVLSSSKEDDKIVKNCDFGDTVFHAKPHSPVRYVAIIKELTKHLI